MASGWDEIKRLAADFQRAQLSTTAHKLSERNCIEVVNKLISLGLIEVIYTIDGKEYLTPNQLEKEIRDELSVHGGRINLVDLQQLLHVDLSHIESKVNEMVHQERFLFLVQGELIDKDYLDIISEEIDETLQEAGQVTIADLAKTFDLPTEFLSSVITERLDTIIHGQIEPVSRSTIFTAAFIAHNIAKIRGILSGVMRPIQISHLAAQYGLSEKILLNVLDTLVSSQRLNGTVQGTKEKATYIPEIYLKIQASYVDSFFQQNNYIEYQQLVKVGVTDGKQYIKKRYSARKDIIYLSSCCVSDIVVDQIEAAVEEACSTDSWVDVKPLVPTPLSNDDISHILQKCLKGTSKSGEVYLDTIFASKKFLCKCRSIFDPIMKDKAVNDMKNSPYLFAELTKKEKTDLTDTGTGDGKQARKDERQKKANAGGGQKGGGGRGSRETSSKKTKNKYKNRKGGDDDDDEECMKASKKSDIEFDFLSEEEIQCILESNLPDTSDDLLIEISSQLKRSLGKEYQEVAKSIFLSSTQVSSTGKKKTGQDQREKLSGLLTNIQLFAKGLNLFEGDTNVVLTKYLLKTLCSDVVNIVFEMVATENLMSLREDETFSPEIRLKLLKNLPEIWKTPLAKLNSSLTGKSLEDFQSNVDILLGPDFCDVMLKKVDKKRERQIMFNHRQCLMEELEREMESPMALHLTVLILFQYHMNMLLHAPGRCVPQILALLQSHLSIDDYTILLNYQDLVIKQLGDKNKLPSNDVQNEMNGNLNDEIHTESGAETEKSLSTQLLEGLSVIKNVVKNMKKNVHAE